jgi:DNA-3-methyladenine glycosylase II
MLLRPKAPYNFPLMLDIFSRFPAPSLFRLKNGAYYQAMHTENGLALARVRQSGEELFIESLIGEIDTKHLAWQLGLDVDLTSFYAYAKQNEALWKVVTPLYGMPIDRSQSLYHALMFVIIEQHISWVNAQKAQRIFVEWANNCVEYEGRTYYAMPKPEQVANASVDDLKPLKITFKRIQMMIDLSRQILEGELNPEAIMQLSPEAMYKELLKIKGVGHWTAAVVVSRARGLFPYVAQNDVALQAAAREYFGIEKSANATHTLFANYGDFAGIAANFTLMRWVLDKYPVLTQSTP